MRIPKSIVKMLNHQIAQENSACFAYLSQAVWCDREGFSGAAAFLYQQSADERDHMLRIIAYLSELEAKVDIPTTQKTAVQAEYASLHDVFTQVLHNETKNTQELHKIVEAALAEKDYRTFSFMQWFLEEQREEERVAQRAISLFDLMGNEGGIGLYKIDHALGKLLKEDEEEQAKYAGS